MHIIIADFYVILPQSKISVFCATRTKTTEVPEASL